MAQHGCSCQLESHAKALLTPHRRQRGVRRHGHAARVGQGRSLAVRRRRAAQVHGQGVVGRNVRAAASLTLLVLSSLSSSLVPLRASLTLAAKYGIVINHFANINAGTGIGGFPTDTPTMGRVGAENSGRLLVYVCTTGKRAGLAFLRGAAESPSSMCPRAAQAMPPTKVPHPIAKLFASAAAVSVTHYCEVCSYRAFGSGELGTSQKSGRRHGRGHGHGLGRKAQMDAVRTFAAAGASGAARAAGAGQETLLANVEDTSKKGDTSYMRATAHR